MDILSCDADGNISPCINTTQDNPTDVPVKVDIPVGADRYKFDLFLYDGADLVQKYEDEDWLTVKEGSGK